MVATIFRKPLQSAALVLGLVTLTACDVGEGNKPESLEITTTDVTSTKVGNCAGVRLGVLARYTDGGASGFTTRVTWSSSNPSVALVLNDTAEEGKIIPQGVGTTEITATFGTLSVTHDFEVTAGMLDELRIVPTDVNIAASNTSGVEILDDVQTTVALSAIFSDGEILDFTTEGQWSIDDANVATVTNGVIRPQAAGSATVTVTSCNAPGATQMTTNFPVTVVSTISSIDVTGEPMDNLVVGSRYFADAIANLPGGGRQDISNQATFSIEASNATPTLSNVASAITADVAGTGDQVKAEYKGVSGLSNGINVDTGNLTSISLMTSGTKMVVGSSIQINVIANYDNGSNIDVTPFAAFTDDNSGLLIDQLTRPRYLNASRVGSSNLTATFDNNTSTVALEVFEGTLNTATPLTVTKGTFSNNRNSYRVMAEYNRTGGGTEMVDVTSLASWTTDNADAFPINFAPFNGVVLDRQNGATTGVTVTATFEGQSSTSTFP